jgi:hypothetical protein
LFTKTFFNPVTYFTSTKKRLSLLTGMAISAASLFAQTQIKPDMVFNLSGLGNAHALFDGNTSSVFEPKHAAGFTATPAIVIVRMNPNAISPCTLTKIRFVVNASASGTIEVFAGSPGDGNWSSFSNYAQSFGNGITALEWHPMLQNVEFLKFVFKKPYDLYPTEFLTGEISMTTSGDCSFEDAITDCLNPADCNQTNLTLAESMGVNNYVGKSQLHYQTAPFETIREYLPWDHIQGHSNSGINSTESEDQPFRFSPSFPGYDLDTHFGNMADLGKMVLGTFKESSPYQMRFNYTPDAPQTGTMNQLGMTYNTLGSTYLDLMERKPGNPVGGVAPNNPNFCKPEVYNDHAIALNRLSDRYGMNGSGSGQRALADDASRITHSSLAYLENWNEQDKWWMTPNAGPIVNTLYERRLSFFTPHEYMAMSFADRYNGGANLTLPLIMSGLTEFDYEYIRGAYMAWWELTGEDPQNAFPFQALNLHHYSINNWERGIMPENDPQLQAGNVNSGLNKIISFRNKYLPNQQIWITEFGYSDHPQDVTSALPQYPNPDMEEVQADWLVRNFMIFNRLGVDRAFTYQLTDDGPNAWHGVFNHTGMIDRADNGSWIPEFRYKKSWYYLYTLRNLMKDQYFESAKNLTTVSSRPVMAYSYKNTDNSRKTHAIWIPQDINPNFETVNFAVTPGATFKMVELKSGSIAGEEVEISDEDNDGILVLNKVSEKPIFLVEGVQVPTAACECNVPMTLKYGRPEVLDALTGETGYLVNGLHPKCNYGKSMQFPWQGLDEAVTLNIGTGDTNDEWEIDGLYLHDPVGQEGTVTIDFLSADNQIVRTLTYNMNGQAIYPFNATGYTYVWKRFENLKVRASFVRIHKAANVSIGELVICGRRLTTCAGDGVPPTAPLAILPVVNGNTVSLTWTANAVQDWSNFSVQMFDNNQNQVGSTKNTSQNNINLDITGLPCDATYTVQVKSLDCENLQSTASISSFNTPPCAPPTPPTPPTTGNCECQPQAITVGANDVTYELENGQILPASSFLYDPCADNVPDKTPYRMFDEQHKLSTICPADNTTSTTISDFFNCSQGVSNPFPVSEWFPGWPSVAAQYPFKAVVHFNEAQVFNGIYIYDGPDQGKISIEYRSTPDAPWIQLSLPDGKSYETKSFHKWVKIFNTNDFLIASDLRVTIKDQHARFAELSLCKRNIVRKDNPQKTIAKDISTQSRENGLNKEKINEFSPRLYPNPTHNEIFVELNNVKATHLTITDLTGKVLMTDKITADQANIKYNLESFAQGIYIVTLFDEKVAVWREKIVKQ